MNTRITWERERPCRVWIWISRAGVRDTREPGPGMSMKYQGAFGRETTRKGNERACKEPVPGKRRITKPKGKRGKES